MPSTEDTGLRALLRGAGRTLLPAPGHRHGPLPPLLLALTVLSGIVDAVSYLRLGHVFVANMTGNVVFLGFALAGASGFSVSSSLIALAAFVVGAYLGGRLVRSQPHRGRALLRVTLAETALLTGAAITVATADATGEPARHLVTALTAAAMGAQNAVVSVLGVPDLTTTVLTRTIAAVFADHGTGGKLTETAGRRLLSVLALAAGAVVGTALVLHLTLTTAVAVCAALVAAVSLALLRPARSAAPWTT